MLNAWDAVCAKLVQECRGRVFSETSCVALLAPQTPVINSPGVSRIGGSRTYCFSLILFCFVLRQGLTAQPKLASTS
jgi:hypothetical protein